MKGSEGVKEKIRKVLTILAECYAQLSYDESADKPTLKVIWDKTSEEDKED